MSDKRFPLTDETLRAELASMLEDLEFECIVDEIRLTKTYDIKFDWSSISKRLVRLYTKALRQELGEEAAQQFVKGLLASVGN